MQAGALIVVMGVSGSGKSHIGAALADALGAPFLEGDAFHPSENIAKMASGKPLTDTERAAWLDAIADSVASEQAADVVLACSALTPYVQDRLRNMARAETRFVLLQAPKDVLASRMQRRSEHFMPVSLLESQLDALSPPDDAIIVDAREAIDALIEQIAWLLDQKT